MKSNYVTAAPGPQFQTPLPRAGSGGDARPTVGLASRPRRVPELAPAVRPVLRGDRETLRVLRAAEMAAWEAAPPATRPKPATAKPVFRRLPGLERDGRATGERWMMLLLAACAAAALAIGTQDLSAFLAGWFRFADNIQKLVG